MPLALKDTNLMKKSQSITTDITQITLPPTSLNIHHTKTIIQTKLCTLVMSIFYVIC